ncbi:MAG: hypothetical protein E7385_08125 [Ruminococcaceae bacterium]|nr:hypothetical protein [Oscillospiraceae bacterium]
MKKFILFIFISIIIALTISCEKAKIEDQNLQYIYEMDTSEEYDVASDKLNHKNVISNEINYVQDQNAENTKKIVILDTEQTVTYFQTLYQAGFDKTDQYVWGSKDKGEYIYLGEENSIEGITGTFLELNIPLNAESHVVQKALENALLPLIDLTGYQNVKDSVATYNNEGQYYNYTFYYYNTINGYQSDSVRVHVKGNGEVFALWINKNNVNENDLLISKEKENKLLSLKLQDMCNTKDTKYSSFNINNTPKFYKFDGEICIQYDITIIYMDTQNNELTSRQFIVIPVRLLLE